MAERARRKARRPVGFSVSVADGKSGDRRGRDLRHRVGRRAAAESAIWQSAYAKQKIAKRKANQHGGQPIIQLACAEMQTKNYGKVPRPAFEIVGWDETASREGPETSLEKVASVADDMDDEIPF